MDGGLESTYERCALLKGLIWGDIRFLCGACNGYSVYNTNTQKFFLSNKE